MGIISGHLASTSPLMTPGMDYLRPGAPVNGTSQVVTLTVNGSPTGGTFKLAFGGFKTAALAHNANSAAVQAALRALPSIGDPNVTVAGDAPHVVTFTAALAATALGAITLAENELTGGTSPTVAIALTTPGVTANPYKPPVGAKHRRLDTNAMHNNAGTANVPSWSALS